MPWYFEAFRCVGGDCPDTCCRDWEVVLDPETAAFYQTVPGSLGREIRAAMTQLDGEPCFFLRDGFCPMLDGRGLCRIQLELGEDRLSASCRQHPRFAEEYGALREWSLSMACPEAVRLLLSDLSPMGFVETVTGEPVAGYNDLDPRLFFSLQRARAAAISMAQDRAVPWQLRLSRLLEFGAALQRNLDQHRIARLDAVTDRFVGGRAPRLRPGTEPERARTVLSRLQALEPIDRRWPEMLEAALDRVPSPEDRRRFAAETAPWDAHYEHLLVYYLFRYFLKTVVDRDVLPKLQLAAVGVLAVRELELAAWMAGHLDGEARVNVIHRFSRQVEHSGENMETLRQWFRADPAFSTAALEAATWMGD